MPSRTNKNQGHDATGVPRCTQESFRPSSGSRNACFAFTAGSTSASLRHSCTLLMQAAVIGSVPARQAEYTTACLALFAGPDGMCDGGFGHRHASAAVPLQGMAERAGCATARWQWQGKAGTSTAEEKEGICATHHHRLAG
ncbi:uncharacterized protein B0H64DRAFT_179476 [Chaetomium fimeti]|uniref:Uncharacterized protein n=1 Tax=Chaetomium fimeti TaxID=1854472 RepID=A0AAE0HD34_9PEZI|nr:hypothetical protein B0H64DRAFT_179476 [Chaetomium fimeti]